MSVPGSSSWRLPPDDFLLRDAGLDEHGAANGENERARTGKFDMRARVGHVAIGAVVACGHADGDSNHRRGL